MCGWLWFLPRTPSFHWELRSTYFLLLINSREPEKLDIFLTNCVVYFQFPKIFKRLVSAPTKSYSKIDMTVRRGLKRRIINRCYYKDLKTRGPHLDHLKVFLEIAYKPPSLLEEDSFLRTLERSSLELSGGRRPQSDNDRRPTDRPTDRSTDRATNQPPKTTLGWF